MNLLHFKDRLHMQRGARRSVRLPAPAYCRGVTLIEVLIALVVFSIGLLGLAGLQTVSLRFNTSAYYRTQATALAYGLADRMRANRDGALDGLYTGDFADPSPDCDPDAGGGGTPAEDLTAWRNALACQLPEGNGAIAANGTEFTITVQWDDSHGEQDPLEFEFTTAL
jgi:type IV pilus assembly protein PilV